MPECWTHFYARREYVFIQNGTELIRHTVSNSTLLYLLHALNKFNDYFENCKHVNICSTGKFLNIFREIVHTMENKMFFQPSCIILDLCRDPLTTFLRLASSDVKLYIQLEIKVK